MGQMPELIDEETDLPDVDEVARAGLRRNMQLAVDQPHQQGFITRLFGSTADRRGFGRSSHGIRGGRSKGGKLLRDRDVFALGGGSLAWLRFLFWLLLGWRLRLGFVESLGIGRVVGEFLRLRWR